MKPIVIVILAVAVIMNLVSFFLMRHDKECAKAGKRRVPEKTLFLVTALFGGIGGTAAMFNGFLPADDGYSDCDYCLCHRTAERISEKRQESGKKQEE